MKERFEKADENEDGFLEGEELRAFPFLGEIQKASAGLKVGEQHAVEREPRLAVLGKLAGRVVGAR